MTIQIKRSYLEIKSLDELVEEKKPFNDLKLEKVSPPDFQLNKFFYKNIGKKYRWVDRLAWDNLKWMNYLENKNVQTYVLKSDKDLIGYFEAIKDPSQNRQFHNLVYLYNKFVQNTLLAHFFVLKRKY